MADTPWLTREQAADYLGLSVHTLHRYAYDGGGPKYYKASHKTVRYLAADLDAWLLAGAQT